MKKETKAKVLGLVGAGAVLFGVGACDNGTTDKCGCPNGTAHEPGEACCPVGTDCGCTIAEPSVRDFPNIPLVCDGGYTTALDIRDERTACGSASLADLGLTTKIQTAFVYAYNYNQERFKDVFSVSITVIVGNDPAAIYIPMLHQNQYTIYIDIDYLKSKSINDMRTPDVIWEMNNAYYVTGKTTSRDAVRLAKAPIDAKTFAARIATQIPQSRQALRQRVALAGRLSRQHG